MRKKEIWKPLECYPQYAISSEGSVQRILVGRGAKVGRILKPGVDSRGYYHVCLSSNIDKYNPKNVLVHRLVARAFIGERPQGLEINHKDGNKLNNNMVNLEYISRSENMKHAFRAGLLSRAGEKNSRAKLTKDNVLDIRDEYIKLEKISTREPLYKVLAKKYNISESAIGRIITRQSWQSI